jgi:hypothetical protein
MEYIEALKKYIINHAFITLSFVLHIIILAAWYIQLPNTTKQENEQVTDYGRQAMLDKKLKQDKLAKQYQSYSIEMQKRIDDMKDIKQVLKQFVKTDLPSEVSSDYDNLIVNKDKKDVKQKKDIREYDKDILTELAQLKLESLFLKDQIKTIILPMLSKNAMSQFKLKDELANSTQKESDIGLSNLTPEEMRGEVNQHYKQSQKLLAQFHQQVSNNRQGISAQIEETVDETFKNSNLAQLASTVSNRYSDDAEKSPLPHNVSEHAIFPVTGKILGRGGQQADRMYLDTWYMMGPFDLPSNQGLATVNPPENIIDFNATYPGKGKRLLQWKHYQAPSYPLVPQNLDSNATYYGFTELYLDQVMVILVGLGCDDNCKVWLNNELIWKSGSQNKPWYEIGGYESLINEITYWNLNESYKKLTFKKGHNKILFRLDNNARHAFFSMVLLREKSV